MTLQELKESIEDRTFSPATMVLVMDGKFLPLMYLREIERSLGYNLVYAESIVDIGADEDDIFGLTTESSSRDIVVLNVDTVDFCNDAIFSEPNVVVVANSISDDAKLFYRNILIEIPKIADWQLQDMVYSYCKGVDTKYLDWLIKECNSDVNRLYNESLKLSVFKEPDRPSLFSQMDADGAFDDLSSSTIFNLTNAIMKRDVNSIRNLYGDIKNMSVNDFGLMTILYNNFMNLVSVQMGLNPSADKLGMKTNQFNAIKYNCGKYTNTQLVKIVRLLTDIDRQVKMGEFPTTIMLDYVLTSILSQ